MKKESSENPIEKYADFLERFEVLSEQESEQLDRVIAALELKPVDVYFHLEMLRRTALVTLRRNPTTGEPIFLTAHQAAEFDQMCNGEVYPVAAKGKHLPHGYVYAYGQILSTREKIEHDQNLERDRKYREAEGI